MPYSTAKPFDTDDWTSVEATASTHQRPSQGFPDSGKFLRDSGGLIIITTHDSAIDPDYKYGLINALTDLTMREDYDAIEDCKLNQKSTMKSASLRMTCNHPRN